jgi:hypothetical protein
MKTITAISKKSTLILGVLAFVLLFSGCSGSSSSSGGGGAVSGVSTPSKVSVVNTN